jgi:protein SCO1/2
MSLRFRCACLALAMLLGACSPPAFNSVDITGANYAQGFDLRDAEGKRRTLADFRGKVVAVFFGFTQCPDVCPTTLADLTEARKRLGSAGEQLQVVFITVDPARDTPQVLGAYMRNFDPSFIGLTGSPDEIERVARDFKVFYAKSPGKSEGAYSIDHTAASYVFDREGRVRLFVRYGQPVDALVADLKRLL